ncbi:MAG: hypothetical protein Q8942_20195 [Bacillota bacterium]|nr:hypothetical protein [Bacillota bacterium]
MTVTNDKNRFISNSLADELKAHTKKFKKNNKGVLEAAANNNTYNEVYTQLISDVILESMHVMDAWENKNYDQLDGMTPMEYYATLNNINDFIELIYILEAENSGIIPNGLAGYINENKEKFSNELVDLLNSMELDEDKSINQEQRAIIHMAEIISDPKFIEPLFDIISKLENDKTDSNTLTTLTNAIQQIGKPAIEKLINKINSMEKSGPIYSYLLIGLARIGSKNKSDELYQLLRRLFRDSELKFIEANALGVYGDGRALSVIRGYIEKNAHKITKWEYSQLREILVQLGGMVKDFDTYFSSVKDM